MTGKCMLGFLRPSCKYESPATKKHKQKLIRIYLYTSYILSVISIIIINRNYLNIVRIFKKK